MDDRAKAIEFLKDCKYMTVAVVAEGEPWAVPVHIQKSEGFNFEWDSHPKTVHSLAIADNPTVALSMFRLDDGEVHEFGFYAIAEASKIADLPDGRARYIAVTKNAWINDELHQKRQIEL